MPITREAVKGRAAEPRDRSLRAVLDDTGQGLRAAPDAESHDGAFRVCLPSLPSGA